MLFLHAGMEARSAKLSPWVCSRTSNGNKCHVIEAKRYDSRDDGVDANHCRVLGRKGPFPRGRVPPLVRVLMGKVWRREKLWYFYGFNRASKGLLWGELKIWCFFRPFQTWRKGFSKNFSGSLRKSKTKTTEVFFHFSV